MEEKKKETVQDLEQRLKHSELKNYILEEENSLLRENVECLLNDLESLEKSKKEMQEQREEINKIMSGKIYKVMKKVKKIIK